jgi:hypothetical protein
VQLLLPLLILLLEFRDESKQGQYVPAAAAAACQLLGSCHSSTSPKAVPAATHTTGAL